MFGNGPLAGEQHISTERGQVLPAQDGGRRVGAVHSTSVRCGLWGLALSPSPSCCPHLPSQDGLAAPNATALFYEPCTIRVTLSYLVSYALATLSAPVTALLTMPCI